MTLQEFYKEVGGDYDGVMGILMKEERIYKYLFKFEGSDDFSCMNDAIAAENYEDAFRYSHNLKGVCLNLGLGALATTASELCEKFRHGAPEEDVSKLQEIVAANYENVIKNIGILRESKEG